jgi:hypothetical protein
MRPGPEWPLSAGVSGTVSGTAYIAASPFAGRRGNLTDPFVDPAVTMPRWLQAEYRDFDEFPRLIVCTGSEGTFFFRSRFDAATGRYCGHYEVYRLPSQSDSEPCASWFGLETRALARLADLPVHEFPFDVERRTFLPYDSIAERLRQRQ